MKKLILYEKVTMVFPRLLELWDYKGVLHIRLLQTLCWKHSLTCLCSEEEIELARQAYHAKVVEVS